ncbi:GIP [Symbiodinium natans]|uniref:GIP protein n=1 Tax=Symbiodinium natans TaxID=878477 RepID=A0A812UZK6_9DINO|nr:GIP [Symbiodinium natans]
MEPGGERDLDALLASLEPVQRAGEYVFVTVPAGDERYERVERADLLMEFKELEGVTFILNKETCDKKYPDLFSYSYVSAWITLTVHSSLEAVGLTAAFASALAREGISANVVAAFFHDHVFVDIKDAEPWGAPNPEP